MNEILIVLCVLRKSLQATKKVSNLLKTSICKKKLKQISRLWVRWAIIELLKSKSTFVEFKNYHEFWSIDAFIECHELDTTCNIKKHSFFLCFFFLSFFKVTGNLHKVKLKFKKKQQQQNLINIFLLHYYFLTLSIDCSNFDAFIIKMKLKYIFS